MTRNPIHGESVATWERDDAGAWVMGTHEVTVALVDGQPYTVPSVCSGVVGEPSSAEGDSPPRWWVSADIGVANGQAHYRSVTVQADHPLSPADLQRIPWRQVAEAIIVTNAAETSAGRASVGKARKQAEGKEAARRHREATRPPRRRRQHTDAFLVDLLERKAEAQADPAIPRYDLALASQLGYSPNHVRKLVAEAVERGLEVPSE